MCTMFPVTPTTRASGVEFGIFTYSLRDQWFENGAAAFRLQLLPAADDVPASDVQNHGFEAERVVVLRTRSHVRPHFLQHPPIECEYISLLKQLIERNEPGNDAAKSTVGLVEVAADGHGPLPEPARRSSRPSATLPALA